MATISSLATLDTNSIATSDYIPIYDTSAATDKKTPLYTSGTWTPTLTCGSGSVTATINGRYIQLGKLVFLSAIVNVTAVSSPSGDLYIPSAILPSAPETNFHFSGYIAADTLASFTGTPQLFMYNNIYIRRFSSGVETADMAAKLQNGTQLILSISYIAN